MPNNRVTLDDRLTLPDDLKSLIVRKLRHQRREHDARQRSAIQSAYTKLRAELSTNLKAGQTGRMYESSPLAAYSEIVASAVASTKEWPIEVWQTVSSILIKRPDVQVDRQELNALVDEWSWNRTQPPFPLGRIESERFQEVIGRELGKYGMSQEMTASFNRSLSLAADSAECNIRNTARHAREAVSIAIDEYLLEHSEQPSPRTSSRDGHNSCDADPAQPRNTRYTPSTVRREAGKLDTQDMYDRWKKEYRSLKKSHPGQSGVWYSKKIAKMDIGQDRKASTIYSNMK